MNRNIYSSNTPTDNNNVQFTLAHSCTLLTLRFSVLNSWKIKWKQYIRWVCKNKGTKDGRILWLRPFIENLNDCLTWFLKNYFINSKTKLCITLSITKLSGQNIFNFVYGGVFHIFLYYDSNYLFHFSRSFSVFYYLQ